MLLLALASWHRLTKSNHIFSHSVIVPGSITTVIIFPIMIVSSIVRLLITVMLLSFVILTMNSFLLSALCCRYGFVVYGDGTVTDVACKGLNGMRMGDRTLTVRRATEVTSSSCACLKELYTFDGNTKIIGLIAACNVPCCLH